MTSVLFIKFEDNESLIEYQVSIVPLNKQLKKIVRLIRALLSLIIRKPIKIEIFIIDKAPSEMYIKTIT